MNKFYSDYCKKHNINKPKWILQEESTARYKKELIYRCKIGWNYSNHIGSKSFNQLILGAKH